MSANQPVPRLVATRLILLGGFLGAGETTTLLRLARHWTGLGRRVGIITNDQGRALTVVVVHSLSEFLLGTRKDENRHLSLILANTASAESAGICPAS